MSLDKLPAEIRLRIASYVDILDLFSLARVSRSWRLFIERRVSLLPKYEISSLRIEQFDFYRFKFKAHVVRIQQDKKTQLKNFFFKTDNDLWLFLQFIRVNSSLYLHFSSNIRLESSICQACRDVNVVTFQIGALRNVGQKININYLAQICDGLPSLDSLILEDTSDFCDEDAFQVITKLKIPNFIEARSGKANSKLRITDTTLLHLVSLKKPVDCIVLSTDRSKFSLKAVRTFLESVEFGDNGLLELFYVDCTTNDFFNLLSDMRIAFESEPIRGIYNSFPINLRGKRVCLNIKYFSDSNNPRGL